MSNDEPGAAVRTAGSLLSWKRIVLVGFDPPRVAAVQRAVVDVRQSIGGAFIEGSSMRFSIVRSDVDQRRMAILMVIDHPPYHAEFFDHVVGPDDAVFFLFRRGEDDETLRQVRARCERVLATESDRDLCLGLESALRDWLGPAIGIAVRQVEGAPVFVRVPARGAHGVGVDGSRISDVVPLSKADSATSGWGSRLMRWLGRRHDANWRRVIPS